MTRYSIDHLGGDPTAFYDLDNDRQARILGALMTGHIPPEKHTATGIPDLDDLLRSLD